MRLFSFTLLIGFFSIAQAFGQKVDSIQEIDIDGGRKIVNEGNARLAEMRQEWQFHYIVEISSSQIGDSLSIEMVTSLASALARDHNAGLTNISSSYVLKKLMKEEVPPIEEYAKPLLENMGIKYIPDGMLQLLYEIQLELLRLAGKDI